MPAKRTLQKEVEDALERLYGDREGYVTMLERAEVVNAIRRVFSRRAKAKKKARK